MSNRVLQTEFPVTLPRGYVDENGDLELACPECGEEFAVELHADGEVGSG